MKDEAEMSAPMLGSVAGPVAWAVWSPEWHEPLITFCPNAAEKHAAKWGQRAVPLYRSPSLTHAEREALECGLGEIEGLYPETAATLRGLLERLK